MSHVANLTEADLITQDQLLLEVMPKLKRDENISPEDYDRLQFLSCCLDSASDYAVEWATEHALPFLSSSTHH